jgi:transcriptional regulator
VYVPPHFAVQDQALALAHIEAWSFATLITGADGRVEANHAPLLLDRAEHALYGHLAWANPQCRSLAQAEEALAVFAGPHAYVSPTWYAGSGGVPTWNFAAVHVRAMPEMLEGEVAALSVVSRLTRYFEGPGAEAWEPGRLDPAALEGLLRGIVCFRLHIVDIQAKHKLSQNRSTADRQGVIRHLASGDSESARAVAEMMSGLTDESDQ